MRVCTRSLVRACRFSERLALRDQEVQALTEQLHKMILSKKEGSERQRRSVFSPG